MQNIVSLFYSVRITTAQYPVPSVCAKDQMDDWFESLAECLHWNVRKPQKPMPTLIDSPSTNSLTGNSDSSQQVSLWENILKPYIHKKESISTNECYCRNNNKDQCLIVSCIKNKTKSFAPGNGCLQNLNIVVKSSAHCKCQPINIIIF